MTHLEEHVNDLSAVHVKLVADARPEVVQDDHGALRLAGVLRNANAYQGVETVAAGDATEHRGCLHSSALCRTTGSAL